MFKRLFMFFLILMLAATVQAQAPQQIQKALDAFNQMLGTSLTLNDFNWSWEQATYPDSSLGCTVDVPVTAGSIVAYNFTFTYEGTTYEYHVSADETIVVYCGATGGTPITPEPGSTTQPETITEDAAEMSNKLCPAPEGNVVYPHTRLVGGMQARVTPGEPNNVRSGPGRDNTRVGEIPSGATFTVVSGPVCDEQNGYLWWEVEYGDIAGWTVERDSTDYFVEPLPPTDLTGDFSAITTGNLDALTEVAKLQGNFARQLTWTATGLLVASGSMGSDGLWVYDLDALDQAPRVLESSEDFTALDATSTSDLDSDAINLDNMVLVGGSDGSLRLWDVRDGATLVERANLQGHAVVLGERNTFVHAVAFDREGARFASVGGQALTPQNDAEADLFAILLWDTDTVSQTTPILRGHTHEVTALAFSPDGNTLYSASLDGSVRGWNLNDGSLVFNFTSEVAAQSMVLSPDGQQLAIGYFDGGLTLLDTANPAESAVTVAAHSGEISSLDFSPDGTVLASASHDGLVKLWDMTDFSAEAQPVTLPALHVGVVSDVAFRPDGAVLATIGVDHTLRLWAVSE